MRAAREIFREHAERSVEALLRQYPLDAKTDSGKPFWAPPKAAPTPVTFSLADPLHVEVVALAAAILAAAYGVAVTMTSEPT